MARDASTYRGYRRNLCIRVEKMAWGPNWYYKHHDIDAHKVRHAERHVRKLATTSGAIHHLLRRGDYAGAVRKFFAKASEAPQAASPSTEP